MVIQNSIIIFDDTVIEWKDTGFTNFDWAYFYQDGKENLRPNAPTPRGNPVQINTFVDASHARNELHEDGTLVF